MVHDTATRTIVVQLATNQEKARELLDDLAALDKRGVIRGYGVNTRSEELEVIHGEADLTEIDTDTDGEPDPVQHLTEQFEAIGVTVRVMTWTPEAIIDALSDYVGRDVQDGWYEGDEWCCAARDYCHAAYYLRGRHSHLLDEYQTRC